MIIDFYRKEVIAMNKKIITALILTLNLILYLNIGHITNENILLVSWFLILIAQPMSLIAIWEK